MVRRPMAARTRNSIARLRDHLDATLFPRSQPALAGLAPWATALLVVFFLLAAVGLQLLRIGPEVGLDSLWAEDGQIFLQRALLDGFWENVFQPYAGYLVVVPRLIGEAGAAVPIRDAPAAIAIAAGLVVGLSGIAVWNGASGLIRSPILRAVLVALTVLCPVASLEATDAGAYVIWYMSFASFWLLLWRPPSRWGAGLAALFILATGLSTPLIWFFAPLAGLRLLAARDGRDLTIVGAYAATALAQVPVVVGNTEVVPEPLWSADIWTALAQRVVAGAALGQRLGGYAWEHLGTPFLLALLALLAVGLVLGLRRADRGGVYFAAVAIPTALLAFVVTVYQRGVGPAMIWPAHAFGGAGGRYAIVPALLLVSVALVLLDRAVPPLNRLWIWGGAAGLAVVLAISFHVGETSQRGQPAWGGRVDTARQRCIAGDLDIVRVAISPKGFGLVLVCDELVPQSGAAAR